MIGSFDAAVIDQEDGKPHEKALDEALTSADKVVKRTVDATADEFPGELQEALKGLGRGAAGPPAACYRLAWVPASAH